MPFIDERGKGRPRSVDSTLLGIKSLILEYIHKPEFKNPTVTEFMHKLLLCFGHGTKFSAKVYMEKSIEVDRLIRLFESPNKKVEKNPNGQTIN